MKSKKRGVVPKWVTLSFILCTRTTDLYIAPHRSPESETGRPPPSTHAKQMRLHHFDRSNPWDTAESITIKSVKNTTASVFQSFSNLKKSNVSESFHQIPALSS